MMSEKRFRTNDLVKLDYSEIREYVDEEHTPTPLRNDEVVDLLNDFSEENKKLNEEWEFSFRTELAHHRVAEKELQEKIRKQQATIDEQKIIIEERDVANERLNRFLIEIGLEKEYIKWEFKKRCLE